MKQKLTNRVLSLLLALAVLVTALPATTWLLMASKFNANAIGNSEAVNSVVEDIPLAPVGADSNTAEVGGDIVVDTPATTNYAEDNTKKPSDWTDDWSKNYQEYFNLGVFDPVFYLMTNPDLKLSSQFCSTSTDGTVTYYPYELFYHFIKNGIAEGRCASPFFCIGCYYHENADLRVAFNNYNEAWNHFVNNLDNENNHKMSPVLNLTDYNNLNSDLKSSNLTSARQLFTHFMGNGGFAELRKASNDFDHIAYFYNNSSLFYSSGALECYRKYVKDHTSNDTLPTDYAHSDKCYRHNNITYTGLADLDESFTATLTNIGVSKNLAVNEGVVVADLAGANKSELWQFTKQTDGTYYIQLADTSKSLTYENTTDTVKYLIADSANSAKAVLSETPMKWSVYESDGLYVLRPDCDGYNRHVLNISDNSDVSATLFNNTNVIGNNYNAVTLNQHFLINTTYETTADSDGLSADFYATIDAYLDTGWDTKVALTAGDIYLRTRALSEGGSPSADQIWRFIRQSDGTYRIINTACGKYLDSDTADVVYENRMFVNDYKNVNSQKWIVRARDNGGYFIMPLAGVASDNEGTYLTVFKEGDSGENMLYLNKFTGSEYSVFDINVTASTSYAYDFNGENDDESYFAYISSAKTDKSEYYLVSASEENEEEKLQDLSSSDKKKQDFYWQFVSKGDGSYVIYSSTMTNACLVATEDGKILLDTFSVENANYKTWFVYKYNGGYRFQLKATGQVLQMDENGNLSLTNANTNNYNDYQLFNIIETDMSISTVGETFKVNLFNYGTRINDTTDTKKVLEFTSSNNTVDKVNLAIGSGDGVIPEMSKVLDEYGYPVVKNYKYVNGTNGNETYKMSDLVPNFETSGSLQYLFDVNRGYVGSSDFPTYNPKIENGDEYEIQTFKVNNPSGLFTKDSEGYYCYDSSKNAAYFDIDQNSKNSAGVIKGTFKVYDYSAHPEGVVPFSDPNYQGAFLPFNLPHIDGQLYYGDNSSHYNDNVSDKINKANYSVPSIQRTVNADSTQSITSGDPDKAIDMWFGMTLETDFFQTANGKLNGQDVKFEFAGDDDVWVYLDGILALDIGNTHGKLGGTINFADSTVTRPVKTPYTQVKYTDGTAAHEWKKDSDGSYASETVSLYSVYYDALQEVKGTEKEAEIEETIRTSFDVPAGELPAPSENYPKYVDFIQHNLKFFYLERGAAASNCSIKLNTFSGGTTVSKEVTGLNEDIMEAAEYKFKIVEVDPTTLEETPLANSPYTLTSTLALLRSDGVAAVNDLETDNDGCFTLRANQKAIFGKVSPGSSIKVYELTKDASITGTKWKTVIESGTVSTLTGVENNGNVTDVIKTPTDQTIDIIFTNDYEPSHNLKITKDYDETAEEENYKADENQLYVIGYQLIDKNNEVVVEKTITLKNGESFEIKDIPVGFKYRVWEYLPEGILNFDIPQFTVAGENFSKVFVPTGSAPGTNNYVEGVISNEAETEVEVQNKLQAHNNITITFKYYDRKRVNGAPAQIDDYYSTYTKVLKAGEWENAYLNSSTQRINFSAMIANEGVIFNNNIAVDNIIDEYAIWTSQKDAVKGIGDEIDFTSGTNATYNQTYSNTPDKLAYHTDAYGNICNCGEKWVTYYKGSNVIDPETQGNDSDVTSITVWLHNTPKTYTLSVHTLEADNLSIAGTNGDLLIGNNKVDFTGYYNQRIASKEDAENDTQNSQQYWDTYKIPADDSVKGQGINGKTYDYLDLPETVNDNGTEYQFMYWSYDNKGESIASTDINYSYRITRSMNLYAVYGEVKYEKIGLTVFENSVDSYVDSEVNIKLRLNTMMSPYNCPDDDETITNAAVMYVFLHGAEKYKNMTEDELLQAIDDTSLEKLRSDIATILNSGNTNGDALVVNVTVKANGFVYEVESFSGTTAKANLTVKNRIQFTTEFLSSDLDGKRMLAFAGMKKSGQWYVSDNFVDYNFIK